MQNTDLPITAKRINRITPLQATVEILGLEIISALWIFAFLKVDAWQILLVLFLLPVALFVYMNRHIEIGERFAQSFKEYPKIAVSCAVILAFLFPLLVGKDTYIYHLLIIGLLYSVLALALNFQLGSANIPNFATGASYGIGAYVSALLAVHFGVNFWYGLMASAAVATFFGFVLGVPCMRTRESYLALVTIAFGIIIHQLLNNFEWTGGANGLGGMPAPSFFGHSFNDELVVFGVTLPYQANWYYISVLLLVLAFITAARIHNSRVGLAWNALRNDELAARCMGINVTWYKVLAFMVDAFLSAFAGTIYAFYVSYISPDNFTFLVSVTIMTMVIVGGMDNIFGVVVGALLLTFLPEKFRAFSDYRLLIYGCIVIGMLILRPQGLFPKRLRTYGG